MGHMEKRLGNKKSMASKHENYRQRGGDENREELEKCMYIIYRDTLDFLETLAFISHTVDGLRLASNILERRMYSGCILQHSNHHK